MTSALAGTIASNFGITAPYWVASVAAIVVSAITWRVYSRAAVSPASA